MFAIVINSIVLTTAGSPPIAINIRVDDDALPVEPPPSVVDMSPKSCAIPPDEISTT